MEKYKKNLVGMKFFYNRNNIPDFDDKETDPFLASDKGLVDPLIGDFDITDPDLLNAEPLKVKLLSYEDFSDIYNEGDIYTAVPFSPEKRFLLFLVDYKYRCEERD